MAGVLERVFEHRGDCAGAREVFSPGLFTPKGPPSYLMF